MFALIESTAASAKRTASAIDSELRKEHVLIPVDRCFQLAPALKASLAAYQKAGAKITFLLIHPTASDADKLDTECELHFTLLKGVQAQLRHYPANFHIESERGPVEDTVVQYAQAHAVDMILLLRWEEGSLGESSPLSCAAAHVERAVSCEITFIDIS